MMSNTHLIQVTGGSSAPFEEDLGLTTNYLTLSTPSVSSPLITVTSLTEESPIAYSSTNYLKSSFIKLTGSTVIEDKIYYTS